MYISVRANNPTANEGLTSFGRALRLALRSGAVSGLMVVGFSLLGVWGIYELYNLWFGGATQALQEDVILSIDQNRPRTLGDMRATLPPGSGSARARS